MNWYYAEGNQRQGPISEAELIQLFQSGRIAGSTLVWKDGMANWEPYSKVLGSSAPAPGGGDIPEGAVVCAQCGQMFSPNDVIRYGDKAVCAACKPVFLQKLREGSVSPTGGSDLDFGDIGMRFVAKMLDGIIMLVIMVIFFFALGFLLAVSGLLKGDAQAYGLLISLLGYIGGFGLKFLYNTIFIGAYGATPGKMVCKLRVVSGDGSKVSYGKAFGRSLAEVVSEMTCLIGYAIALFDDEKRALHDRICDTRVVKA